MKDENIKLCPYRTKSIVYHNKPDNVFLPKIGIMRKIDHDVVNTSFMACIKDKCMAYNQKTKRCMYTQNTPK